MTPRIHAAFAVAASVVVISVVGWGFLITGSPTTRRQQRFDNQRLQDLQTITREIQSMVVDVDNKETKTLKEPLPKTLEEAAQRATNSRLHLRDPETGEPYAYAVKDETTFELCASFSRPRDWDSSVFWNHPAGRHCFTIKVLDPPPFY